MIQISQKESLSKEFIIVAFLDISIKWKVEVSYIVFIRDDFWVGAFIDYSFNLIKCSQDKQVISKVDHKLQKWE